MSTSASPYRLRFLFDENVDARLVRHLRKQGLDVEYKPKGLANGSLARLSHRERRVLVTNDADFAMFKCGDVFSVVWLRIPQDKLDLLTESFSRMLKQLRPDAFEGNIIRLFEDRFETNPLNP